MTQPQNICRQIFLQAWLVVGREGFEPSKVSRQIYSLLPLATWVPTREITLVYFLNQIAEIRSKFARLPKISESYEIEPTLAGKSRDHGGQVTK